MPYRAFRFFKYIAVMTMMFSLSGCAVYWTKSKYASEQKDPDTILLFGYLDDSDAPFKMKRGEIKQVRPATKRSYKEFRSDKKGIFYLENLPVGSYELMEFSGPDKWILSSDWWDWNIGHLRSKPGFEKSQVKANAPGVYYMGSYRIDKVKDGGLFSFNKYETVATDSPSEKEILEKLLSYVKGTKWEGRVRERISSLK